MFHQQLQSAPTSCIKSKYEHSVYYNVYSCIMYVVSYMSKPEKTLGEVLLSVSKTCEPRGPKDKMHNIAKTFLSNGEISVQESAYRLLSLPLTKSFRH